MAGSKSPLPRILRACAMSTDYKTTGCHCQSMTPRPHVCVCVCVWQQESSHYTQLEPLYVQHDTNNQCSLNSQDVLPLMQALDSNQLLHHAHVYSIERCLHHSTLVPKINTGNTHNKHGSPRATGFSDARRATDLSLSQTGTRYRGCPHGVRRSWTLYAIA